MHGIGFWLSVCVHFLTAKLEERPRLPWRSQSFHSTWIAANIPLPARMTDCIGAAWMEQRSHQSYGAQAGLEDCPGGKSLSPASGAGQISLVVLGSISCFKSPPCRLWLFQCGVSWEHWVWRRIWWLPTFSESLLPHLRNEITRAALEVCADWMRDCAYILIAVLLLLFKPFPSGIGNGKSTAQFCPSLVPNRNLYGPLCSIVIIPFSMT